MDVETSWGAPSMRLTDRDTNDVCLLYFCFTMLMDVLLSLFYSVWKITQNHFLSFRVASNALFLMTKVMFLTANYKVTHSVGDLLFFKEDISKNVTDYRKIYSKS